MEPKELITHNTAETYEVRGRLIRIAPITENELIYVLGRREFLLKYFRWKRKEALNQLMTNDEAIQHLSLKGRPLGGTMSNSGPDSDGILRILENRDAELKEQMACIEEELDALYEAESKIDRIWQCVRLLKPEHGRIINDMFIKKHPWDYLIRHYKTSRSSLARLRQAALNEMMEAYHDPEYPQRGILG